jgi:hypothetical protein
MSTVRACGKLTISSTPTATELMNACEYGAKVIKIFPCGNLAGPKDQGVRQRLEPGRCPFDIHLSTDHKCCTAISLPVIRIAVTPVPVAPLLPGAQLNESTPLVVLGLIPLVRAVFIAVPSVIVLVALVVVSPVVFALPVFLVPVTLPIFAVPVVLRAGRGHHRNGCSKGSSQKK